MQPTGEVRPDQKEMTTMGGTGPGGSPLIRSMRGLSFVSGVMAAYALVPDAYERSAGHVWRFTMENYGPQHVGLVLLGWKVLLALVAYSLTTAVFNTVLSILGLRLVLKLMERERNETDDRPPAKPRSKSTRRLMIFGLLVGAALIMEFFK